MTQEQLQSKKFCWHGNPVKVEFGQSTVWENKEKPLFWYNFECYQSHPHGLAIIEAIRVTQGDQSFVLANHFGIGISKLIAGGWPNHSHFSLPDNSFKPHDSENLLMRVNCILEFDEEKYAAHEAHRHQWQKETFPVEFAKMQAFKDSHKAFMKKTFGNQW